MFCVWIFYIQMHARWNRPSPESCRFDLRIQNVPGEDPRAPFYQHYL